MVVNPIVTDDNEYFLHMNGLEFTKSGPSMTKLTVDSNGSLELKTKSRQQRKRGRVVTT